MTPATGTDDASVNCFTLDYYEGILGLAKAAGYQFQTLQAFWHDGCPPRGRFVLRHDLDAQAHLQAGQALTTLRDEGNINWLTVDPKATFDGWKAFEVPAELKHLVDQPAVTPTAEPAPAPKPTAKPAKKT